MGQRSQIYVRYNGDLIIANYYGWNYAERMISRACYGIGYMKHYLDNKWYFAFQSRYEITRFSHVFDVNFDMKDVAIHCDIIQEYNEQFSDEKFNDVVFDGQDNNDGQLLVDIVFNEKSGEYKLFYAFREIGSEAPMNALEYMIWDSGKDLDSYCNEYMTSEQQEACKKNISEIHEMAELMTRDQIRDFITADYDKNGKQIKKDGKE